MIHLFLYGNKWKHWKKSQNTQLLKHQTCDVWKQQTKQETATDDFSSNPPGTQIPSQSD